MTSSNQIPSPALVTGASRGFGARSRRRSTRRVPRWSPWPATPSGSPRSAHELGDRLTPVVADVADPVVAGSLVDRYRPGTLVLNAGATPLMRPLHQLTWEAFSRNWEVDVRHAFHWVREALLRPLLPAAR